MTPQQTPPPRTRERLHHVVVRFAGDSGDGMQLTGDRFTAQTAEVGNDLATLPDFPAEIRAPAGTIHGVSSFQLHFSDQDILTPGDAPDVLVAMNAAALKKNLGDLRRGGTAIVNTDGFSRGDLKKAGYLTNPLEDGTLSGYQAQQLALTELTTNALSDLVEAKEITNKDAARAKNMFALGLVSWMFGRPIESTVRWLETKFARNPTIADANVRALKAGYHFGETTEVFAHTYEVQPAQLPPGRYRNISGNLALAYGIVASGVRSGLPIFYGSYPITPASDILHELARHKRFGIRTFQAEDEIAAVGAALGAAFGGALGITASSGPGIALKAETVGLAVSVELPLIVIDVQRAGPSTGMPTKTEQGDLLQVMFGRNGEAPVPVVAARSPGDCFDAMLESTRIALRYRTPVVLLTDGYLGNGSEPWRLPDVDDLPDLTVDFATEPNDEDGFLPFKRDPDTLARPWALPGTPGLEHRIGGLEKADVTGNISYEPGNHHRMTELRQAKIDRIADDLPPLEVDDPEGDAQLLVVGWGSTYGPIQAAARRLRTTGHRIAHVHLRHLNPFPRDLGDVLHRYERILVPEQNLGQLRLLLRGRYLVDAVGYNQVRGLPLTSAELEAEMTELLRTPASDDTASRPQLSAVPDEQRSAS